MAGRIDWKVSATPVVSHTAGEALATETLSADVKATLGGGNSSQTWAASDTASFADGVCTHISSEDTSSCATSSSDALWIKHSGFDYDAAKSDNKGTGANTANLTVKIGTTAICVLGPGEGIFIPKPADATWQFADDGTACAVEYAVFT